jgi:hypothetical protein
MTSWRITEETFPDSENDEEIETKSRKILGVFMTIAFIEHFISKAEDYESASFCFEYYSSRFEAFSRSIIPMFFKVFPYNHLLGFFVILTCFYSTVLWNFSDVFLITIFFSIFIKLKKFNRKIYRMKFRHGDEKFWEFSKLNYIAIHERIKETNNVIAFLVIFSLVNDFYFVCNQALGAFK